MSSSYPGGNFGGNQLLDGSISLSLSQKIMVGRWCRHRPSHQSVSLRLRVFHPPTRVHVRLLGPCFKTGPLTALSQRESGARHRPPTEAGFSRTPNPGWQAPGAWHRPLSQLRARAHLDQPMASPSTISSTFWLSFQSSFHLSLTVLVRYRSLASI